MSPRVLTVAAVTLAFLAGTRYASAQTAAIQIPLQFDYLSPGARSLGMGGAFIGASDDASTAYANPAGLTKISTREISIECRYRGVEMAFLQGGRLSGTPTGTGVDTINGPTYGTEKDRSWAPGFISFVLPLANATMGFYRHESVSMESSFAYSGAFLRSNAGTDVRDLPITGEREMTVRSYGGAIGGKLHDRFAVGLGMSLYAFGLKTEIAGHTLQSNTYSPVDWNITSATASQDSWAASWGMNLGALWSVSSDVSIGAQWRRGPGFSLSQDDYSSSGTTDLLRSGTFKIPAAAGAGVQWHVTPSMRVVADYDWVQYSQLRRDLVSLDPSVSGRGDQLRVDDGHEVHGGMEYLVLSLAKPLAFRAGAWYDPAHTVWYDRTAANDPTDALLSAALPKGKSIVHYTGGFGIALSGKSELNIGLDVSSESTYMTASGVIRF